MWCVINIRTNELMSKEGEEKEYAIILLNLRKFILLIKYIATIYYITKYFYNMNPTVIWWNLCCKFNIIEYNTKYISVK